MIGSMTLIKQIRQASNLKMILFEGLSNSVSGTTLISL